MQSALTASSQEAAQLLALASLLSSETSLDALLNAFMEHLVRTLSCNAALIYLYQAETESLLLAGANERYRRFIGSPPAASPQESIIGGVIHTRRPFVLEERAVDSPGMQDFSGMGEGQFEAVAALPLLQQQGNLCHGVLCLLSSAEPYSFRKRREPFIDTVVALLVVAIERARLSRISQRYLTSLTPLSLMSQIISSDLALDGMLHSLVALARELFGADLCLILLLAQGRLAVESSSPDLYKWVADTQSFDVDPQTWETLLNYDSLGLFDAMGAYALEHLNPLKQASYQTLLPVPLIVGMEYIGLLNFYFNERRQFTNDEQIFLRIVGNMIALAIKYKYLSDLLAPQHLLRVFFGDLLRGSESEESLKQRAISLGADLDAGYVVSISEIMPVGPSGDDPSVSGQARLSSGHNALRQVRELLSQQFPGSLMYEHEHTLTCLVCQGAQGNVDASLKPWLRDLSRQLYSEQRVHMYAGISNSCQSLHDYPRGHAEAGEALEMGRGLMNRGGEEASSYVTHFNDLGSYRYFYKIAHMDTLRDMYLNLVERIVTYDRQKDHDLLNTLMKYYECGGNMTKTASQLDINRGTVMQRLERLQSMSDIDLQDRNHWLALQVASQIFHLRESSSAE